MTSALLSSSNGPDAPPLARDLDAVGIEVLALIDCTNILQEVVRNSPELVVIYESNPTTALFASIAALKAAAPCPVTMCTSDPNAENIALATRSGVHAYVVNGYSQNRLRSVLHLAQARFSHDELIRAELEEVNQRFAERKLVDRAKGILMGARQLREEEAFRALRMLSQRLAKAALMTTLLSGKAAAAAETTVTATTAELVEGFAYLNALPLSNAEIGGELVRATQAWDRFQAALVQARTGTGQEDVAVFGEVLLAHFDRLTDHIERGMQALIH